MKEATQSDGLVMGVDIGGTKLAGGFVNPEGEITKQIRVPMAPSGDLWKGLSREMRVNDYLAKKIDYFTNKLWKNIGLWRRRKWAAVVFSPPCR